MPIYFGSNFAREPFQFDSVGNDWEQESVTRPEGYPLYHYLQTKEGVGEVTVYSRNQAVSDNILSNSHTIELQKGQGILIAPNVPHSYHNKNISSGNSLPWKTEFATFTGTMAAAFREMFDEKEYRLIDDRVYTENFIRMNQEKKSRRQIAFELQQKGVDRQDISRILEGSAQDDLAAARNLLKKRLRTADLSDLKEKNRLGAYLGRRGFSYDVIRRVMQEVQSGQEE